MSRTFMLVIMMVLCQCEKPIPPAHSSSLQGVQESVVQTTSRDKDTRRAGSDDALMRTRAQGRLTYAIGQYEMHAQEVLELQRQAGQLIETKTYEPVSDVNRYAQLAAEMKDASHSGLEVKSLEVEAETQRLLAKRIALVSMLQAWSLAEREEQRSRRPK